MGNQNSSPATLNNNSLEAAADRALRPFTRHVNGALGLSRAELDKRSTPSGLYNSCSWEDRAVRKLIADGKIAARLKGGEYRSTNTQQECPICFLYYDEVNVTKCCNANVCSECYLQVRPQHSKQPCCPFCNANKFTVTVAERPSESEIRSRQKEEQTVIESRIRAEQGGSSSANDSPTLHKKKPAVASESSGNQFGSELEKDERFQLLKKRTESFASAEEGNRTPQRDAESIKSIAMTPEERRRLEDEMKAQHAHPLSLRVEAEAQERILQNEQAYFRSNSAGRNALRSQRAADLFRSNSSNTASATRRLRYRGARDWNQIVDSFENGGNGEVNSLDDLVVLEAAILLSMEEEARRERVGETAAPSGFDAARHAGGGFPLVRSLLGSPSGSSNRRNGRDEGSANTGAASSSETARSELRNLSESRRRQQYARAAGLGASARNRSNMPDASLDTAALMMRGITEEEQIAMAIAASLQEQSNEGGGNSASEESSSSSSSSEGNSSDSGEKGEESGSFAASAGSGNEIVASPSPLTSREASVREDTGNGVGAMTISDLARVVTDSGRDGDFATDVSGSETHVAASNGNGAGSSENHCA